jgi:hypothetical protein
MDETVRGQIEIYQTHLKGLTRRGLGLRDRLGSDPSDSAAMTDTRMAGRLWRDYQPVIRR